ncbi:hypothetical protein [Serinicoccus sp. LYQ131]|uniref:iron-sulfur cluster-binding protein n=1 Tax=Serinicoccus sp. LYQ131 TaxID=3378797 RepID=UPI00385315F7
MLPATGAPEPVVDAVVALVRASGPYDIVSLAVPGGPVWDRARPGQLLVLPGAATRGEVLPRVLWLAGVRVEPVHGTTAEVVLPVGHGLVVGAGVRLLGPLGRGFPLPAGPTPTLLIGHEGSVVPLRWLVALLRERDCPVHTVLSADDPDHHLDLGLLRRQATSVVLTDPQELPAVVAARLDDPDLEVALVVATGPLTLVREVAALALARGLTTRVAAVDPGAPVVCGTGLCGQCDLVVGNGDGGGTTAAARTVRACLDGPVVPGEWVLGAPR